MTAVFWQAHLHFIYSVGHSGDKNKNFLMFLFLDKATGIQFLKDMGLIRSEVQCNSRGHDMTLYAEPGPSLNVC